MPKYFGRRYRIDFMDENDNILRVIDSTESDTPLQIEFGVETSFGAALSLMELSIYGLSRSSIRQIFEAKKIELHAGYLESFGPIFKGRITNPVAPKDGVERKTTLYCWSGYKEHREKSCEVSYKEGTKYQAIIDFIAKDIFGEPVDYIGFDDAFKSKLGVATDGYSESGPHKTLLNRLAKDKGFQWLIENERCVLMARGSAREGTPYIINPYTGLIGSVELTFLGANFEMLLNPNIQIGDRVTIESRSSTINFSAIYSVSLPEEKTALGDGAFVVKTLRRRGDFYSKSNWVSSVTCWREGETGLEQEALLNAQ